jgi:Cys-tRNA(Pro)/Cys-tRNA(Cys) deacylase
MQPNCWIKRKLKGDKSGYFVCVIPGADELGLKLAAKASGNKNCDLIPQKDLLPLTGYIRGGCSPMDWCRTFICDTLLSF